MKLAAFSDIHFHPWPAFSTIAEDGLNSRLHHTIDRAREICGMAAEENCTAILFGGDLFHTKKIDAETIDATVRTFAGHKLPIIGVPGNHDMSSWVGHKHSARALSDNFHWLDDWGGRLYKLGGTRIYGIPYHPDPKMIEKEVDAIRHERINILLMHCGFAGSVMGSDYIADIGDCMDPTFLDGVADLVVSGHFHQPQVIQTNSANSYRPSASTPVKGFPYDRGHTILIPGAPEQHNCGDMGSARGFWIIDTTANLLRFIKLESPEFVWDVTPEKEQAGNYIVASQEKHVEQKPMRIDATPASSPEDVIQKYVDKAETQLDRQRLVVEGRRFLS